jgi:hypothetical protein
MCDWWFIVVPFIVLVFLFVTLSLGSNEISNEFKSIWNSASPDGKLLFFGLVFIGFMGGR